MANTKVTTGVIKDDAVGADQLASNSVVTDSIVDNAITTAKINNDAILTAKISNSAVTNAKLSANSVDSDQYVDGSIDTAHIGDGQITSAKLDTNISVSGELTVGSHLNMGDGDILKMGAGADLQIYHDGSHSYIDELVTGDLRIRSNSAVALLKSSDNADMLVAIPDGAVTLYYAGATKIATTSSGVDVTGTITSDGLTTVTSSNSNNIQLRRNSTTTDEYAQLGFSVSTGTGADNQAEIRAIRTNSPNSGDAELVFLNRGSGTGPTEAMRIDAEHFVLIGKTSSANVYTTAGIDMRPSGTIFATRDQAASAVLSRTTNDGEILNFRKDGSAVGSIGTASTALYISNDDTGLQIYGGGSTDQVVPCNATGATRDNAVDLGKPTGRFKDLYLSGTAYIDTSVEIGNIQTATNFPLIVKSGTNNHAIAIEEVSGGETWQLGVDVDGDLGFYNSGSATASVTFDDSGKVGIGVTPSEALHIEYNTVSGGDNYIHMRKTDQGAGQGVFIGIPTASNNLRIMNHANNSITFHTTTSDTERMRIQGDTGNVGIGVQNCVSHLSIGNPSADGVIDYTKGITFVDTLSSPTNAWVHAAIVTTGSTGFNGNLIFATDGDGNQDNDTSGLTEAMRIDNNQNLNIGTQNDVTSTNAGVQLRADNTIRVSKSGASAMSLYRLTNNGSIVSFYYGGQSVGSIETVAGLYTAYNTENNTGYLSSNSTTQYAWDTVRIYPTTDNAKDLGLLSHRFDDIFATNGTIQTSDRNEKQDIEALSEAETRVAVAAKGLLRKFRWQSAVEEKGDEARIHFGIIAQDLQDAFTAEGLDAGDYAMFISSTWWEAEEVIPAIEEELDEDGNVVTEAQEEKIVTNTYDSEEEAPENAIEKTRLGVRYSELLAFIIAAI